MKTQRKTQIKQFANRSRLDPRPLWAPCLLSCSAALSVGCSGDYPLGDLLEAKPPLLTEQTDYDPIGDSSIPAALAAADITIGLDSLSSFSTVRSLGDFNGDGFDDFAAVEYDTATFTEALRIRYGGPRLVDGLGAYAFSQSGAHLLVGSESHGLSLSEVVPAGDVNGDGFGDVLLSTLGCDPTLAAEGVYLLLGRPDELEGVQNLADLATHFAPEIVQDPRPGESVGCSGGSQELLSPGDLDGDGFDDFLLADNVFEVTSDLRSPGLVHIFYGQSENYDRQLLWQDADATLAFDRPVSLSAIGDTDGDGRGEVVLSSGGVGRPDSFSFLLRQRGHKRISGKQQLADVGQQLSGVHYPNNFYSPHMTGDLDGDGLSDVILVDDDNTPHLFYGSPDLFDDDFEISRADAIFKLDTQFGEIGFAGDRDGDGDSELAVFFLMLDEELVASHDADVTMLSGSKHRLRGEVPIDTQAVRPDPKMGRFGRLSPYSNRILEGLSPAGDLDGDGADDLYSISARFTPVDNGGFSVEATQLHIHYGILGNGDLAVPLR